MPAADLTFSQAVYEGGPTVTARAIANAGASPPKLPARVVLPDIDYNACQLQGTEPFWVNNQLKGAIVLLPGVKEVASNNPGCWSEQNGVPLAWDAARQGAAALVILDAVDITNAHEIYTGGKGTSLSDMNIQVGTVGGARVGGKDVGGFPAVKAGASGGAPTTLSGILHASSTRGRGRLAAGRRRASGLLAAVAASLLSSSSASEDDSGGSSGDENEEGEGFVGGARRRIEMLRRRRRLRLEASAAGTTAVAVTATAAE